MSLSDRSLPECKWCFDPPETGVDYCARCQQIRASMHKSVDDAFRPLFRLAWIILGISVLGLIAIW